MMGSGYSGHGKEGNPTQNMHTYICNTYIHVHIHNMRARTHIRARAAFFVTVPDGKVYRHLHLW